MAKLTSSSIIKISLIGLLIFVIFAAALGGGCVMGGVSMKGLTERGSASVDAASVKNLEIDWAAGDVAVEVYDSGTEVMLEESTQGISRAQEMEWGLSGGTLSVSYGSWFSCSSFSSKHLTVKIPKQLAQKMGYVSIDGASGNYSINDIATDETRINLASGKLRANNLTTNGLRVDLVSGSVDVSGRIADDIKIDVVSGNTTVNSQTFPREIRTETVSGTVTLGLPENDGFTARVDKVSGSFTSDFEFKNNSDNQYVYKQGAPGSIRSDMVSGKLIINRI